MALFSCFWKVIFKGDFIQDGFKEFYLCMNYF